MKRNLTLSFCLLIGLAAGQADPPPGSIKLLPGYQHKSGQGIDSRIGTIWKGNFQIHYDIGLMAGDYLTCKTCWWTKGEVWRKAKLIDGKRIVYALTRSQQIKTLVVSFPKSHANFYGTITSDNDINEMLQIVSTYRGEATD